MAKAGAASRAPLRKARGKRERDEVKRERERERSGSDMDTGGLSPSDDGVAMDQAARMDELSRMLGDSSGHGQVSYPNKITGRKNSHETYVQREKKRERERRRTRMCGCIL